MDKQPQLKLERRPAWDRLTERERKAVFSFAQGYLRFLSAVKTERENVAWAVREGEGRGFVNLGRPTGKKEKLYRVNHDISAVFLRKGRRPFTDGCRLVAAHIDTPRLDLKSQPLFAEEALGFLRTHYYGGIKKYQWVTLPLALHGMVALKDGQRRDIVIGEAETDPVFTVTDLLPHLAREQMKKEAGKVIEGESLLLLVGSLPAKEPARKKGAAGITASGRVKDALLALLHKQYGITEEDFISAELRVVPAGKARELGFDRGLVLGYGQDCRICAYAALQALWSVKEPEYACLCLLVDREETGSDGTGSIQSSFPLAFLAEAMALSERDLRRGLASSRALCADVNAALDPGYRDVMEPQNAARLGEGVVLSRHSGAGGKYGTSEARAEFVAWMRALFAENRVVWQTGDLGKIDKGGGGTIAKHLTRHNIETIDVGPPLLSMHSPWEAAHKADLYQTWLAYRAFFEG